MATFGLGVFYGGVITGIPVVTGVAEGVHHQKEQNKEAANETRMIKFYIDVFCQAKSSKTGEVDGGIVVVHKDGLWVCRKNEEGFPISPDPSKSAPHPFTGFYIMYPDEGRNPRERGLVTTLNTDPPMLNWIYVDKTTQALTYGNRSQSIAHVVGPWDWTEDESGVTLEGWEGFIAVEVSDESEAADGLRWKLYYDRWDDKLAKGKLVGGKRVLPCSLERRPLPDEVRKAQEEAAERKMQVKSTGGLKTKLDLKDPPPKKK